jgi:hypothetical protein
MEEKKEGKRKRCSMSYSFRTWHWPLEVRIHGIRIHADSPPQIGSILEHEPILDFNRFV